MPQIYEDTRQKPGKHEYKRKWFEEHGVSVERRALATGDYERADGLSNVLVDTKRSISELAMDVGRDHTRFVRELDRARDAGCRLVVLVEVSHPYHVLDDVARWTPTPCKKCRWRGSGCNPHARGRCLMYARKPMQGPTVVSICKGLERDHGCRFEFVHPFGAARRICELLGIDWR